MRDKVGRLYDAGDGPAGSLYRRGSRYLGIPSPNRPRILQEHAGRFGHDNVPSRHFVAIYRASYHQRGASPRRLS